MRRFQSNSPAQIRSGCTQKGKLYLKASEVIQQRERLEPRTGSGLLFLKQSYENYSCIVPQTYLSLRQPKGQKNPGIVNPPLLGSRYGHPRPGTREGSGERLKDRDTCASHARVLGQRLPE